MTGNDSNFVGVINANGVVGWFSDYFITQMAVIEVNFVEKAKSRKIMA